MVAWCTVVKQQTWWMNCDRLNNVLQDISLLPIIHVEATWLCNTQLNISEDLVQVFLEKVSDGVSVYIVRII